MQTREFLEAAQRGDYQQVLKMLDNGMNVNSTANIRASNGKFIAGSTALHEAAANGHITVMTLLIKRGALVDLQTECGWTALHAAIFNEQKNAALFLVDKGANLYVYDNNKISPLMCAESNRIILEGDMGSKIGKYIDHKNRFHSENEDNKYYNNNAPIELRNAKSFENIKIERKLSIDEVNYIANLIKSNKRIVNVDLSNCELDDQAAIILFQSIRFNEHLIILNLSNNKLGSNPDSFIGCHVAQLIRDNTSLTSLTLANNDFSDEDGKHIGNSLSSNYRLKALDLHNSTRLSVKTVNAFVSAFKHNINLEYVGLMYANISSPGFDVLANAMVNNHTLLHYEGICLVECNWAEREDEQSRRLQRKIKQNRDSKLSHAESLISDWNKTIAIANKNKNQLQNCLDKRRWLFDINNELDLVNSLLSYYHTERINNAEFRNVFNIQRRLLGIKAYLSFMIEDYEASLNALNSVYDLKHLDEEFAILLALFVLSVKFTRNDNISESEKWHFVHILLKEFNSPETQQIKQLVYRNIANTDELGDRKQISILLNKVTSAFNSKNCLDRAIESIEFPLWVKCPKLTAELNRLKNVLLYNKKYRTYDEVDFTLSIIHYIAAFYTDGINEVDMKDFQSASNKIKLSIDRYKRFVFHADEIFDITRGMLCNEYLWRTILANNNVKVVEDFIDIGIKIPSSMYIEYLKFSLKENSVKTLEHILGTPDANQLNSLLKELEPQYLENIFASNIDPYLKRNILTTALSIATKEELPQLADLCYRNFHVINNQRNAYLELESYYDKTMKRPDNHYLKTYSIFHIPFNFGCSAKMKKDAVTALIQVECGVSSPVTLLKHRRALKQGELGKLAAKLGYRR